MAYDPVGNLVSIITPNGQTVSFEYDTNNRLVRKNLPGGGVVTYSYTPTGQRTAVTDARGTTSYSYDTLDRLVSVIHPTGQTVSYARDANGNLASLNTPSAAVNYTYDALNRLTSVAAPEGQSQTAYDLAGNKVRLSAANGLITDYTYDVRNRPTQLAHRTVGGTVLQSFTNTISPAGRRTQVAELNGSVEQYSYDARGRLVSETRTGSNPYAITHTYDGVGNRTQMVNNGIPTTFTYDFDDRLLSDGTATYTYDANGNLTRQTAGSVITQYGYDAQNRLTSVVDSGGTSQFTYDPDGNRVQSTSPAGTTQFLVDSENNTNLAQVIEERDGTGSLQARYTYGDDRLAMVRGGTARVYHSDAHGSTRMLTDGAGAITDTYNYDSYSRTVSSTGSTVNPYRYSGERSDSPSGLYHLRARYYNPALGRFMSRDPFGGRSLSPVSLHQYLYANADPVNYTDPTGLDPTLLSLTIAQVIQNGQKVLDTINRVNTYCSAKAKLGGISDLLFIGRLAAAYVSLLAETQVISPANSRAQIGAFVEVERGNPLDKYGLKKLQFRNFNAFNGDHILQIAADYTGRSNQLAPSNNILQNVSNPGTGKVSVSFNFTDPAKSNLSAGFNPISIKFVPCGIEAFTMDLAVRYLLGQSVGLRASLEGTALQIFRYAIPLVEISANLSDRNIRGGSGPGPLPTIIDAP